MGKEQVLTREKVEAALHRIIIQRGPWQPEEIEVRVSSFTPLSLPPGRVNFRVLKPQRGITPGFRSFLLEVIVEGKEQTRLWVRSEIRVIREVVVISRPLARYQVITAEDVRLEKRDAAKVRPAYVAARQVDPRDTQPKKRSRSVRIEALGHICGRWSTTSRIEDARIGSLLDRGRVLKGIDRSLGIDLGRRHQKDLIRG